MLCYIDSETTGLDVRIHQPWELTYWREDHEAPVTHQLPHTLVHADPRALEINGYFDRFSAAKIPTFIDATYRQIASDLTGVTLVGSKPEFDMAMLKNWVLGYEPWHHRPINVSNVAMVVFDWPQPKGLADVRIELLGYGYGITEPDHTSEADVRATREAYLALRQLRQMFGRG